MPKKILILSASVGSGHVRAGQAIERALHQLWPDCTVHHVDVLTLTNATFRRCYGKGYFDVVAKAPHLIGYLYDYLDRPLSRWQRPADILRSTFQRLNFQPLLDLLTCEPWDLAINTHFLPAEVISQLRRAGEIDFPQLTVTTDFDTHRLWHNDPCEHYFTATDEGRIHLAAMGVPANKITASGIPIDPVFANNKNVSECKHLHHLCEDRPVVLQMCGGLGIESTTRLHANLLDVRMPLQVIAVTGRNASSRSPIEAIPCPPRHRRTVLGYTNAMDELMAAADLIVTKPGGLTSSEALARGLPMVMVDPIPGQESRNSDYLLENGAAIKINNHASLAHKITALLENPRRLQEMQRAARRLARPTAATDIAEFAMNIVRPVCNQPAPSARFRAAPTSSAVFAGNAV